MTPLHEHGDFEKVKTDMHCTTHTVYRTKLGLLGKGEKQFQELHVRSADDVSETQGTRPPFNYDTRREQRGKLVLHVGNIISSRQGR